MKPIELTEDEVIEALFNDFALTTIDNPINPLENLMGWYSYDLLLGHHTWEYLARVAKTRPNMSDEEQVLETRRAMKEICELNPTQIYYVVAKPHPLDELPNAVAIP